MVLSTWLEQTLKERQKKKDREERELSRLRYLDRDIEAQRRKAREEGWKEGSKAGLEKERAKALEEGIEAGLPLGRKEERQRWEAWNRRREAAAAAGEEFSEPPPGLDPDAENK